MKPPLNDPYVYPGTSVLINRYNLTDQSLLDIAESLSFQKRLDSGIPDGNFNYDHLKKIHHHFFQDIYEWAGKERMVGISKGDSTFAMPTQIEPYLNKVFAQLSQDDYLTKLDLAGFCKKASHYFSQINAVHPFREGNGRIQRLFLDKLAAHAGYKLSWDKVSRKEYIEASISSFRGYDAEIEEVFSSITHIADRNSSLQIERSFEPPTSSKNPGDKSVITLLKSYLEKEIELSKLVSQKIIHFSKDPALADTYAKQAQALHEEIKKFAQEAVKNPVIVAELKLLEKSSFPTIGDVGGFEAIEKRFSKADYFSLQDKAILLKKLKQLATSLSWTQNLQQVNFRGGYKY